jgi:hypothetical protein
LRGRRSSQPVEVHEAGTSRTALNPVAVSEPFTPRPQAAAPSDAQGRSLIEIAGLITLGALAFAAIVGVIAVIDADSRPAGFALGFGVAALVFFAGAAIASALACLVRGRLEYVALGVLVAACLTVDLVVLGFWLDIDSEAYGKAAGVAFLWSFFGLVVLGLALAVAKPDRLALALFTGAVTAAGAGALISTYLVVSAGEGDLGDATAFGVTPVGDDALLQVLGAMFVLMAAFWFGALAASRLPDQTLKRTFTTSPSSTT